MQIKHAFVSCCNQKRLVYRFHLITLCRKLKMKRQQRYEQEFSSTQLQLKSWNRLFMLQDFHLRWNWWILTMSTCHITVWTGGFANVLELICQRIQKLSTWNIHHKVSLKDISACRNCFAIGMCAQQAKLLI